MGKLLESELGALLETIIDYRGKTPKKLKGDWSESGIPALSAKNIKHGKIVNEESIRFVDEDLYARWMKAEVKANDILMTSEAPLGETFFVKTNNKLLLSQRLFAIRANKSKINPKLLYYYFNTNLGKHELQSRATGTTVGGIRQTALNKVIVHYPKGIKTQARIASVITTYDDLIENNEKRIKILEEMAQRLYTEWFVKFKFPGHEKVKMVESGTEYGKIPEGWEVRRLGEDIELAYGKALKEEDRIPGNVLVCGSGGIVGTHNKKFVSGPGIVIGRKGNAGSVFWVNDDFYPIDTAFFVKTNLSLVFAFYLLKAQNYVLGDAAVPGLNREQTYRNQILVPLSGLIDRFAQKAELIRNLIAKISDKNKNLIKTRDLLIPQLVTGKRGVK